MFTRILLTVAVLAAVGQVQAQEQLIPVPQGEPIQVDSPAIIESEVITHPSTTTTMPCPRYVVRKSKKASCWAWWVSPGDMIQHKAYCPTLGGNYYFRPYNVAQLDRQYQYTKDWGLDSKAPYDNRFFQTEVYDRLPQEWFEPSLEERMEVIEEGPAVAPMPSPTPSLPAPTPSVMEFPAESPAVSTPNYLPTNPY